MPIDASIPLQVRPIPLENPVAQYGNVMAIQNAMNQNRLADLQYRQLQTQQSDDEAVKNAFRQSGGDLTSARNALMGQGLYKPAMALDSADRERRLKEAQITEKDLSAAKDRLTAFSGLIAPLATAQTVTHEDVVGMGRRAESMGLLPPGWEKGIPLNAMELPKFVKGLALATEQGRKAVEAMLPKPHFVDTGPTIQAVNQNPLAGDIGEALGAPITKAVSPGQQLTADVAREGQGVTIRGQDLSAATTARGQDLTDARAREAASKDKFTQPFEATINGTSRMVVQDKTSGQTLDANTLKPIAVSPKLGEGPQKQLTGAQNTSDAIAQYRDALQKFNTIDILNPNTRATMGTLYNNMLLQAKEAFNLGVLNGPDYKILQEVITSPLTAKGAVTSKKSLDEQAQLLENIMGKVRGRIVEIQTGNQPGASSGNVESIRSALSAAGQQYEPAKYEYRIQDGKVQRKPK